MENELTIFNFEGNQVRTAKSEKGEPIFCLSDLCETLGLKTWNTKKRMRLEGIYTIYTLTEKGYQSMLFVNEANVYRVILQSRKPEAEKFQDWICEEIIPSIRKTGQYAVDPMITKEQEQALKAKFINDRVKIESDLFKLDEPATILRAQDLFGKSGLDCPKLLPALKIENSEEWFHTREIYAELEATGKGSRPRQKQIKNLLDQHRDSTEYARKQMFTAHGHNGTEYLYNRTMIDKLKHALVDVSAL